MGTGREVGRVMGFHRGRFVCALRGSDLGTKSGPVGRRSCDGGRSAALPLVSTSRPVRADVAREIFAVALALLMAIGCAAVGGSP